jgi:alkylation response protein AidB-like acyl-CoA dehydrogenase
LLIGEEFTANPKIAYESRHVYGRRASPAAAAGLLDNVYMRFEKRGSGAMELQLTQEQRMIKRTARELAEERFAETTFEWDDGTPWENAWTLAEHDLLAITIPEEYGGQGMSPLDTVVAVEGVGSVCPDSAGLIHGASFGLPRAIAEYGGERLKEKYLPSIADGTARVGIAISEPEAGSDLRNLSTSA